MNDICPKHNIKHENEDIDCFTCNGSGTLEKEDDFSGEIYFTECYSCKGIGSHEASTCWKCTLEYEEVDE